jgi:predicted kinase
MVDGEYQFDNELAGERHEQNYQNFLASLEEGKAAIIVDNTNVKLSQFAPYADAAQVAGYAVVFVELAHPDLDVAFERTTHGVPKEVINQMMLDWEPAQFNAIVEDVTRAASVIEVLQAQVRVAAWVGVAIGSLVGSLAVALAWLIWPGC